MFPPTAAQSLPVRRSFRAALRDTVDLAIAFVTLESYGLDDLRPALRSSAAAAAPGSTRFGLGAEQSGASAPARVSAGAAPSRRELIAAEHRDAYRRQLRSPGLAARRAGSATPREQLCLTPLDQTGSSNPTSSPRRRTAPQDASH